MRMEKVPIQKAVGMVLGHDVTRIVPGEFKGVVFKKGHVILAKDVAAFLEIGKEHVFVLDPGKGFIHENEAALRLAGVAAGRGIELSEPAEGKVTLWPVQKGF